MSTQEREFNNDDVILAILVSIAAPDKETRVTSDARLIHEGVCELRDSYSLLQNFPFSNGGVFRYSNRLERVINRLLGARVLIMETPDFSEYIIKPRVKRAMMEHTLCRFTQEELSQIREIADRLSKCWEVAHL